MIVERQILKSEQGMSLAEFMVAIGIASILTLVLASSYVDLVNRFFGIQAKSELIQEGILIGDVFAKEITSVSGGVQPLSYLIKVENECDASGPLPECPSHAGIKADRVTVMGFDASLPECQVTEEISPNTLSFAYGGECCLKKEAEGHFFMASIKPDFFYAYANNVNTDLCTITTVGNRFSRFDSPGARVRGKDWKKAYVSFLIPYEYFVKEATHELQRFNDKNNDSTIDANEITIVSDHVYDLQAALGYDVIPDGTGNLDGRATDQRSSKDEWLYNHVDDKPNLAPFDKASWDSLKAVGFGLVFGRMKRKTDKSDAVKLFNGPTWDDPEMAYKQQTMYLPIIDRM